MRKNPINYISSKTPPFLIFMEWLILQSLIAKVKFENGLERANIESELISVRDGGHGKKCIY